MSSSKSKGSSGPNRKLLEEINGSNAWFHAKKTRPIWARIARRRQTVKSLEGDVEAKRGDYVCRGHANEKWVQSEESVKKKYRETDKVDSKGWRCYQPRRDAVGVMAAPVPRAFSVVATWGKLRGKKNDLLVKHYDDRENEFPEDVWIVDRGLFEATYKPVE